MYLPDYLLVHDPHDVSVHCDGYRRGEDDFAAFSELPPPPRKYRRAQPEILKTKLGDAPESESWKERETVAHLYLHQNNCIGVGHHSFVYRAPLELPPPLSARSRNGRVIVAAKIAMHPDRKREMLKNEGEIYNKLPKHMSENWCGYNLVAPIPHPVPVGPIVPKFYGYYVPFEDSEEDGDPSPVLLLEECGEPIKPHRLTVDQKTECYSLMYRLHRENVVQNSFFVRNILRQPGPLHVAPEERSDDTPSFRIIDFGTATIYKQELRSKSDYNALVKKEFRSENRLARDELELDDEDFHF
ncbi:hypothetical protein BC835DRAFT_1344032 [Cytidiella melzeri]|nr:hypothetical protein BC835DRAFT_1344032 [Cytidiella melzeri]